MLLALMTLNAAPAAELELGLGGQSLLPGAVAPAARGLVRVSGQRLALDLSATWTPGVAGREALTRPMLIPSGVSWVERHDQLAVSLLGDWILGEAESAPFHGSPHLYGGLSGWQARTYSSGEPGSGWSTERGLAPTLGGGLSVGVGRASLRFTLTSSPRRSALGSGFDPMLRGSWDLIVRP